MECGKKQKIFIVAMDDETGKAYPKEIYIDDNISTPGVEVYLENNCIEYFCWSYDYEYAANMAEVANSNHDNGLLGKFMKCKQCGKYYYLTLANVTWYDMRGLDIPKRCMACRKKNREKNYLFN